MFKRLNERYLPITSREDHPDYAAKTIQLRKPNKPSGIEGLRPISLTSCVGKVLEHVLNTWWNRYLEAHNVYPDSMLGFRAKLGTQDAMLLIQREVLDPPGVPPAAGRKIVQLHQSIPLSPPGQAGGGRNEARRTRGGQCRDPTGLGHPPFLFNTVIIEVARSLEVLGPGIRHCLYADDVTICATGGSDGDIEAGLQAAVDAVESTLSGTGLRCSPQKSQLLILPPHGRHRKKASQEGAENIIVRASDGMPIPHVPELRFLGMFVDGTQTNATVVKNVTTKMGVAARLVKRVSSRYRGMKETGLLRLLQDFVISHAAYAGAFHRWTSA
ncbi:uncharacterized protein LOC142766120 [Rhipicephalus microplus]|uniref:uncharacterized protein LOC142766120 n=1 Tax=Rhipicephalus microplus TaxID=6941 RepID=UPI003F6A7C07